MFGRDPLRGPVGVIGLAAFAYVAGLAWTLRWNVAAAPAALTIAVLVLWLWGRHLDGRGPRRSDALLPLAALYALPFARLALWNSESPVTRAFLAAPRVFHDALPGPRVQDDALPLPFWVALMLVRLLPFVVLPAAMGVLPLAFGRLVHRTAQKVRRVRSRGFAAALAVTVLVTAAIAWPVACDTHESFEDVPNARCTCEGFVATYYPPGWFDAGSTDYCIGIERPVPSPS